MKIVAFASAVLLASAAGAVTVPNGDFTAGNSGFTSGYAYGPGRGDLANAGPTQGAGYYAVVGDAQFSHPSFYRFGDHTTGSGLYLVANGAVDVGVPAYISAAIAVQPFKTYTLSAFFANAYPVSPANIDFRVALGNGGSTSIGTFTIPNGAGVWNAGAETFTTGKATRLQFSFTDLNTAASGNDFAIDDIKLTAVPEAATWTMMIVGFGLVGAGLRRRGAAIAA